MCDFFLPLGVLLSPAINQIREAQFHDTAPPYFFIQNQEYPLSERGASMDGGDAEIDMLALA